jgi:ABC-type multidrug transport system fused ATPase/permease subunit
MWLAPAIEIKELPSTSSCAVDLPPARIELHGLVAGYGDGEAILNGVDANIAPGTLVGVAGPSGCGKTTLLLALVGLVAPRAGQVRIDGLAPEAYGASRGRVAFVGSEAAIFAGTLRSNLAYGVAGGARDELLRDALTRAQADDLLSDRAGGLDRAVGEDGRGLSAGQRQRLALARALARRPALLVLDEPTANFDRETESRIAGTLRALRGETTCVVVSHHDALLDACDVVYEMREARLTRRQERRARSGREITTRAE